MYSILVFFPVLFFFVLNSWGLLDHMHEEWISKRYLGIWCHDHGKRSSLCVCVEGGGLWHLFLLLSINTPLPMILLEHPQPSLQDLLLVDVGGSGVKINPQLSTQSLDTSQQESKIQPQLT